METTNTESSNEISYDAWLKITEMFKEGQIIASIPSSVVRGHAEVAYILSCVPQFPVYRETLNRLPFFSNPLYCVDVVAKTESCDLTSALTILWTQATAYAEEDLVPIVEVGQEVKEIRAVNDVATNLSTELDDFIDLITTNLDCSSIIMNKQIVWSQARCAYSYFITCLLTGKGTIRIAGSYESVVRQIDELLIEADTIRTQREAFDDEISF